MPRNQNTERVLVVRTDTDGNVLDYDVVEQPVLPPINQKTSRGYQLRQNDAISSNRSNVSSNVSTKRSHTRQAVDAEQPTPPRRRVRYVPQKSTFKIFRQKLDWHAGPRIESHNDGAIRQIRRAPKRKIFGEKLSWDRATKLDTHNEEAVEGIRQRPRSQIFEERIIWNADPKVDTHNEEVVETLSRAQKPRIHDEKVTWQANPKVDTRNEEAVEYLRNARRPTIYDEKLNWQKSRRTDHFNNEYVQHIERDRVERQKTALQRARSFPSVVKPTKPDRPRIDHYNLEYVEHKKTKKSTRLPPIEDRKLEWKKQARINLKNDDYIERLRQKRSIPVIFREKLQWVTDSPRIEAQNPAYLENVKQQKRPVILDELPRWTSQPKIDAYNEDYDPDPEIRPKPLIINEKPRWRGRPKIDTGLEPIPDKNAYVNYGLAT